MEAKIGLRERKYARTKQALVSAAVEALEKLPLEEVSVKSLCSAAEVSEATFFNYFEKKTDLLDYYIQLWILEMGWQAAQLPERGLQVINAMFELAASRIQKHPGVMGEIIAYQAIQREKPKQVDISVAERLIAFPDKPGIEKLPVAGLDTIWMPNIQAAMDKGQLPANAPTRTVMVGLASIFYGVPLVMRQGNTSAISNMYNQQLSIFWAGIRAAAKGQA